MTAVANVDQLVACNRSAEGDAVCASSFIQAFGRRAFRRPLAATELQTYLALAAGHGEHQKAQRSEQNTRAAAGCPWLARLRMQFWRCPPVHLVLERTEA
ncbi:MAG TPA: DUF1595 domain-containing protein [Polyangiaceae bacterium]|jgi:hypothetical protein|nr:DUF1595 domain-containing protein [Polyangiaceae bacterium]